MRKDLILATTAVWAIRLAGYLTWRNHGLPEGTLSGTIFGQLTN